MDWLHDIIGRGPESITWWQMSIRAAIVFVYLLVLVRLGGRRAFGHFTPFDIVLGILLGSTLSRCLTANAPFFPTLAAGAVLVGLHVLLAALALRWGIIGALAKGREVKLVEEGAMLGRNLRRVRLTEQDLKEQLRSNMKTQDLNQVEHAYLERSGEISFISR